MLCGIILIELKQLIVPIKNDAIQFNNHYKKSLYHLLIFSLSLSLLALVKSR